MLFIETSFFCPQHIARTQPTTSGITLTIQNWLPFRRIQSHLKEPTYYSTIVGVRSAQTPWDILTIGQCIMTILVCIQHQMTLCPPLHHTVDRIPLLVRATSTALAPWDSERYAAKANGRSRKERGMLECCTPRTA